MRKVSQLAVLVLGCLPVFWALGVLALAARARAHLGYWPSPYHPDPQVLPFELHDSVLYFSGYAVFWTLILLPVARWFLRDRLDPVLWGRSKALFAGGWLAILVLVIVPPVNFVAWYLD